MTRHIAAACLLAAVLIVLGVSALVATERHVMNAMHPQTAARPSSL